MKLLSLLSLAILLPCLGRGELPVRLIGVMNFGDVRRAIMELEESRRPFGPQWVTVILREGESQSKLEVISVDLANYTAQLRFHGTNLTLSLPEVGNPGSLNARLTNAPLGAVLRIYAELTGLTLLQHPELAAQKLSISSAASDGPTLATVFAAALTNAGVVSIPDGDKFLRILPAAAAGKIQSIGIPLRGTKEVGAAEMLPAGAITFIPAKTDQVAPIQAELLHRKLEPYRLNRLTTDIVLQTRQPLSRAEIVYALDVHFAWRGLRIVTVDDQTARLEELESKP